MIVDAHTHLGYYNVFEEDFILKELLKNMERNEIDASIVQPGSVLDLAIVIKQHNVIAPLSKEKPRKIIGTANSSEAALSSVHSVLRVNKHSQEVRLDDSQHHEVISK